MADSVDRPGVEIEIVSETGYGSDEFDVDLKYDDELERALIAAEFQPSQSFVSQHTGRAGIADIEDLAPPTDGTSDIIGSKATAEEEAEEEDLRSPFERFRKRGFLSVSDLVGPIWCETQYDYRLRTLPFLPPEKRPDVIRSTTGKEIVIDKVKVEGKERILRRGEKIHKRLEREIHPEEVVVTATTREDVWGLRFLNMLSAVEALLTLGKCRELPVVGFTNGIMIMGVIDEITRQPLPNQPAKPETRATRQTQTALTSFFSPSKPRSPSQPELQPRTHKLFVSDSKTRASGTLPREGDTLAGRLQVMMYKEILDAILLAATSNAATSSMAPSQKTTGSSSRSNLPSKNSFAWTDVFDHLQLDSSAPFSNEFIRQSRAIVVGNGLRYGASDGKSLDDMCAVWARYVEQLGVGTPQPSPPRATKIKASNKGKEREKEDRTLGRTEDMLELVYRRAGPLQKEKKDRNKSKRQRRRKRRRDTVGEPCEEVEGEPPPRDTNGEQQTVEDEEHRLIQLAIAESLKPEPPPDLTIPSERPSTRASDRAYWGEGKNSEDEREEDELAWAVEMSLGPGIHVGEGDDELGEKVVATSLSQSSPKHQAPSDNNVEELPQSSSQAPAVKDTAAPSTSDTDDDTARSPSASTQVARPGNSSGSIIGRTRFSHSPTLLSAHIESVLGFWMGSRPPTGVEIEEARRCGWCEFEDGCEWRQKKAEEIWKNKRS